MLGWRCALRSGPGHCATHTKRQGAPDTLQKQRPFLRMYWFASAFRGASYGACDQAVMASCGSQPRTLPCQATGGYLTLLAVCVGRASRRCASAKILRCHWKPWLDTGLISRFAKCPGASPLWLLLCCHSQALTHGLLAVGVAGSRQLVAHAEVALSEPLEELSRRITAGAGGSSRSFWMILC